MPNAMCSCSLDSTYSLSFQAGLRTLVALDPRFANLLLLSKPNNLVIFEGKVDRICYNQFEGFCIVDIN